MTVVASGPGSRYLLANNDSKVVMARKRRGMAIATIATLATILFRDHKSLRSPMKKQSKKS